MAGDDKKSAGPGPDATILVTSSGIGQQTNTPYGIGPESGHRAIQPGDVLNHIFEVKRFIARGGMGEVFEGMNVNTEERVAIKVMLPAMSADEKVLALFRKEARTLTRLNHPALVQYRVLAQEPMLGVFYIVTEFVDGRNLSDVIGDLNPTAQDLVNLTRRLASGLDAAHMLGAIHRDMSPDNVMLEDNVLAGARIIDFGIAKDTNAGAATIIGDGFAGKLNYVAPEQLGDFDQTIGPWTDVYSLGLIILAVAKGKDVDMGTTLVNAVDRRRAGPDLSEAPEELRPMLAQMLRADPLERIRSMSELLSMLPVIGDKPVTAVETTAIDPSPPVAFVEPEAPEPEDHTSWDMPEDPFAAEHPIAEEAPVSDEPTVDELTAPEEPVAFAEPLAFDEPAQPEEPVAIETPADPEPEPVVAPEPAAEPEPAAWTAPPSFATPPPPETSAAKPAPAIAAKAPTPAVKTGKSPMPLILGGVVAVLLAGAAGWYFLAGPGKGNETLKTDVVEASGASENVGAIKTALTAGLPSVACTWLDVGDVSRKGNGVVAALHGVAGKPSEVQAQVTSLLAGKNLKVSSVDMSDVAPIDASECGPLDTLRQIRDPAAGHMTTPQRKVEMTKLTRGGLAGTIGATAVVEFNLGDPSQEMSLFGVEPSGKISQLTPDRATLVGAAEDQGGNRYKLPIDVNHTGWSGLILLTGQKPFDGDLLAGPAGSRTGDWAQRFLTAAKERGWKAEMVWFNAVNEQPDDVQSEAPAPK